VRCRLVVNIIAGEVVEPMRRTSAFGKLQGCIMLGQGIGYLSEFVLNQDFVDCSLRTGQPVG
jgi:hypothetical protein